MGSGTDLSPKARVKKKTSRAPSLFSLGCKITETGKLCWNKLLQRESRQSVVHYSIICLDFFQVSRNFELVGRVNLDQLEQMKEKMESSSSDDEDKDDEMSSKAEDRG